MNQGAGTPNAVDLFGNTNMNFTATYPTKVQFGHSSPLSRHDASGVAILPGGYTLWSKPSSYTMRITENNALFAFALIETSGYSTAGAYLGNYTSSTKGGWKLGRSTTFPQMTITSFYGNNDGTKNAQLAGQLSNTSGVYLLCGTYSPSDHKARVYVNGRFVAESTAMSGGWNMTNSPIDSMGGVYGDSPDKLFAAGFGVGPESAMPTSGTMLELYSMMQQTVVDPAGGGDWNNLGDAVADVCGKDGNWNILCRGDQLISGRTVTVEDDSAFETLRITATEESRANANGNDAEIARASGTLTINRSNVTINKLTLDAVKVDAASSAIENVDIDSCRITGSDVSGPAVYLFSDSDFAVGTERDPVVVRNSIVGETLISVTSDAEIDNYVNFVNNTFTGETNWLDSTDYSFVVSGESVDDGVVTITGVFSNNILLSNTTAGVFVEETGDATINFTGGKNIADDTSLNTLLDTDNTISVAERIFIDPTTEFFGDYRLTGGSLAYRNAEVLIDAIYDIDGILRGAVGTLCNSGASESASRDIFTQLYSRERFGAIGIDGMGRRSIRL
jgi:hypothetical protein